MLQFVPSHVDVRFCTFCENIEKGLTKAFADVRRRSKESTNFTVHVSGTSRQGGHVLNLSIRSFCYELTVAVQYSKCSHFPRFPVYFILSVYLL